jgi:L-lactate dehydrogenase
MEQWPGFGPQVQKEVFEETKAAGAQVIKLKGGSGFAVGLSIREVVESILLDSRRVVPVSTLQQGLYGVRDVCLSVPTIVGCGGAREHIELPLTLKERTGIQNSARVLREIIDQVESRVGKSAPNSGKSIQPRGNAVPQQNGRTIPRSAWSVASR